MPRQLITLRLDGITAGDYIAHVSDPEPAALGAGLASVTLRAEPLGDRVEAILVWEDAVPELRAAAAAAGLPVTAEVASVEVASIAAVPAPAPAPAPAVAEVRRPGRLAALVERAAVRMATRPWQPSVAPPRQPRWA